MIKRIKNHIVYKKKLKLLKVFFVNQFANIVVSKNDYIVGFEKLLITMSNSDNAAELQKMFDDYISTLKATIIANKVTSKKDE